MINSLKDKKFRDVHKKFVIEGNKMVKEIITCNPSLIDQLICTEGWLNESGVKQAGIREIILAGENEIAKISSFKTAAKAMAVLSIPEPRLNMQEVKADISLMLDTVQDPGNLGTIIRTADWFGIKNIICSEDSADCYNPKVLQSTMGSILRVNVFYSDLRNILSELRKENMDIYGTFTEGEPVYKTSVAEKGIIVMGNESKGISPHILPYITKKISIPSFAGGRQKAESLNVAVAAAIICSEFKRRTF